MRILVADDHSLFRDGLVSLLEAAGYQIIAEAGDGKSAIQATIDHNPDLVLLDLSMPEMDGHQVLVQIRERSPDTKVVILTVSDEDRDLHRAIEAGAHGYLLKSLDADQFLEMLNGLERGEAAISRKNMARLMTHLRKRSSDDDGPPHEPLTDRELELLALVGQGLSNRAIAQQLSISTNTVKYHMKNIFQKLEAQNRTEAVANAIHAGLLPDPHDN